MIPCENCITLAICKAKVSKGDMWDLISLTQKCKYMKYFIFPGKNPLITAEQAEVTDVNKHIDQRILDLRDTLLKGVEFNDQFTFEEDPM